MKIGIIGSGGREHAICHSLNKSDNVKEIFCFPGNAGTEKMAKNINPMIPNGQFPVIKANAANTPDITTLKISANSIRKLAIMSMSSIINPLDTTNIPLPHNAV